MDEKNGSLLGNWLFRTNYFALLNINLPVQIFECEF